MEMTARGVAAALTTGNTVVVKSPELDPLTHYYYALAAEAAGFPAGAVNIICGLGHEAGAALSSHKGVDQLVFTGSVPTGVAIATAAAQNVVPCVLELGGKSAAIVYDDADIENLLDSIRWGIFFNAGQVCSAMSRLIVHSDIHDQVVSAITDLANSLSVGPGIDRPEFGANMGAMVSEGQRNRAVGLIERAQSEGAVIAAGGNAIDREGFFLHPTILTGVTPAMDMRARKYSDPSYLFLASMTRLKRFASQTIATMALSAVSSRKILIAQCAWLAMSVPARFSSTSGTPVALRRRLAVTSNRAMAAKKVVKL